MQGQIKDILDTLGIYLWVFIVGLIGGILNIGERKDKGVGRKCMDLMIGLLSSCFFGWMGFEVIKFYYRDEQIALAGCGFFAWKGATWVGAAVDKVFDKLLNDKKGEI